MPFLDGRIHIFECENGHRWESGDRNHHPSSAFAFEKLCGECGTPIITIRCPVGCSYYTPPDGLLFREKSP